MISVPLLWIFVATIALVWYLTRDRDKSNNRFKKIPGPRGWPILGNALQLSGKQQHKVFNQWTEEYGPIYKVGLGVSQAVMISDLKMTKEILSVDSNYVGRPVFQRSLNQPTEFLWSFSDLKS